jgi:hypothetical protein
MSPLPRPTHSPVVSAEWRHHARRYAVPHKPVLHIQHGHKGLWKVVGIDGTKTGSFRGSGEDWCKEVPVPGSRDVLRIPCVTEADRAARDRAEMIRLGLDPDDHRELWQKIFQGANRETWITSYDVVAVAGGVTLAVYGVVGAVFVLPEAAAGSAVAGWLDSTESTINLLQYRAEGYAGSILSLAAKTTAGRAVILLSSITLKEMFALFQAEEEHGPMPWGRGINAQGMAFENRLESVLEEGSRLSKNFKTWDFYGRSQNADSAKSMNMQMPSYMNKPGIVYDRVSRYIDAAHDFESWARGGREIEGIDIASRRVIVGVPLQTTGAQWTQLLRAIKYGKLPGVRVVVIPVK